MPKPLTVWITTNCWKFWKRWEYHTTLPASWETCMQVKKQQLEPDIEQWADSKLEKNTSGLYIVTLLIYLVCRVYHAKCHSGWSTTWNQDCWEKYQQPQICKWHHPYGRKWRGTKEVLGGVLRWQRNRTRRLLSLPQIHQKAIWTLRNFHKTTSEHWRRTPGTHKGSPLS